MRQWIALFIPHIPNVVPEIIVMSMFNMDIGQGAIEARFTEQNIVCWRISADSLLDSATHFHECQFCVMVARHKGDMPAWSAQEVAQRLEKGGMRGRNFLPLLQRDVRCYDAIIEIRANGKIVETVAIDNQFNVIGVAERSTRLRRAQQSTQRSLLSRAKAIESGVTVGNVQIAYDQFHFRHRYPICCACSFILVTIPVVCLLDSLPPVGMTKGWNEARSHKL